jgi:hypothetical protein
MKSLNFYTEQHHSDLFSRTGAFFAFNGEQYKKGVKGSTAVMVSCGYGMFCPEESVDALIFGLEHISQAAIQQRLNDYGLEKIILYELCNYECFYTGDISDAIPVLADYGASYDDVLRVYNQNRQSPC